MNVLFLSLLDFQTLDERNIYTDLLREFRKNNHFLYIVSPMERRKKQSTYLLEDRGCSVLKLKIGNVQKTNYIEKSISLFTLQNQYIKGIKKYFRDIKFDLILYATPPVTFQKVVKYVKDKYQSSTYLLLKDIWPQGIVDLGVLRSNGIVYQYFRKKEKEIYMLSDYIGCMSKANVQYVRDHYPYIESERVELCPNCIEPSLEKSSLTKERKKNICKKYGIPDDKTVFIYGGNLGKPQGIDFVIECIRKLEQQEHIFVLIVGSGTDYEKLQRAIAEHHLKNTRLESYIPKKDYDTLLQVCHVGLIFLDYRFTIPNFPSRLLSYLDASLPVLAIVDSVTDIGEVVEEGGFGWSCSSRNVSEVVKKFKEIKPSPQLMEMGKNGKRYLIKNYNTSMVYPIIMSHFENRGKLNALQ